MCSGTFTRGDLNCAAALVERTDDLITSEVPAGASCAILGFIWYFARGSLEICSCLSFPRRAGEVGCVDVVLVCNGERKGAASLFRDSFWDARVARRGAGGFRRGEDMASSVRWIRKLIRLLPKHWKDVLTTRFTGFAEVGSYINLDDYHRSVSDTYLFAIVVPRTFSTSRRVRR